MTQNLTSNERLAICNTCNKKQIHKFVFDKCSVCNCFIIFKVTVKNTNCPENKWIKEK